MEKSLTTNEIIELAFKQEDPLIISEISKETTIKFLGESNVDLYITTSRNYLEKRIRSNIIRIHDAITQLSNKTIRDTYINQVKIELNIKELKNQNTIKTIDVNDFLNDKTAEISGENDIVKESSFSYDASILNKKRVVIELHNKSMNKQFKTEINPAILSGFISYFERRKLTKKLEGLLALKYEAATNDTQEVIDMLIKIKN